MEVTRRGFLKLTGVSLGTGLIGSLGFDLSPAYARVRELKIAKAKAVKSICPYCSVSCGVLIYSLTDGAMNVKPRVIHVEGDPDDPVNRGTLCPKGATLRDFINSPQRLTKPLYRAPGSTEWKEITWEEAIERIARRIKDTRDRTFIERDAEGRVVNRCESIFWLTGCTIENEPGYLMVKLGRLLGLVALETQARV
ncbi:molybdopterin oxidoreductase Fe4S4 region [Thermocrinis albus DSM 14484]|uniref:Molybdopterin oxidoreductase Fe4S4 region n=3 Tax=Thermocrinis TaxID=75905 RepID=D3SLG1_THEAH|nr:molybdopterin oxidoreductase Fe4S4 region [Thermocrinis albus DSM 14484]